jgi:hypothetical protein
MADSKIPKYRGKAPDGTKLTLTGTDEELNVAFDPGEEGYALVRFRAKQHNFKENSFGALVLQQQLKISHLILLDDAGDAELIVRMRDEIKRREDEAAGQQSLDDEIDGAEPSS